MTKEIAVTERHMFWHENIYAIKVSNPKKRWDIDHIIREITRVPENSHHVPTPLQPISVFGIEVNKLEEFVQKLKASAEKMTESYTLQGVTRTRKQSKIKPIMMVGIASYPEPDMRDTANRRRWIELVINALKDRVEADGGKLVSVVLHLDESFPHLHCICVGRRPGSLVRSLHWGLMASDAEPIKSKKGEAYREKGAVKIQDWFFDKVGAAMGWLRNRPESDRLPRMTLSQSNRIRQKKLEDELMKIEAESRRLLRRKHVLDERELMAEELKVKLAAETQRRLDEIDSVTACIYERDERLKANEQALAKVAQTQIVKKSGIDKEWEILVRKANQVEKWEASVRSREKRIKTLETLIQDQFEWERHKQLGVVPKPAPGRSSKYFHDVDLDDIPF